MQKLYVLDASGYLYRSYFAIRNMTNSRGESTNALFGFIRSVMKLIKDFHPEHLVAVFDGPQGGKEREAIYPEYKAHRAATPGDLGYQIEWAKKACELMGIPHLDVPGVEADDTMGSIAVWASQHHADVYLCTSDKDLAQLVNPHVFLLNTHKENQLLGIGEVEEVYGVPPHQMIDYLAMIGDSSDNIPGLPGFGPKTVAPLLKQFGSLDYIIEHPEVISGKKREILIQHTPQALLSRRLVTINKEVNFPKDKTFFALSPPNLPLLKEFYASMNFNTFIKELETSTIPSAPSNVTKTYEESAFVCTLVDDTASLEHLCAHLSSCTEVAINTKGTEEQPIKSEWIGISFCTSLDKTWYVPLNGKLSRQIIIEALKPILESSYVGFYGHDIKYDYQLLSNYGISIASVTFDTMLASYILNSHSRQHGLDALILHYFGKVKDGIESLLGKGKNALLLSQVALENMCSFCCQDVRDIFQLKELLFTQLQERNLLALLMDLEIPLLFVLAKMERHGIYLDPPYFEKMSKEVLIQLKQLENEIYEQAGEVFNINSPKQLSQILFVKMGITPPKKTATGLSTNADVLESLKERYPFAGKILEYRTLEKLRSTYLDALPSEVFPKTGRIHCTFNQSVAATGRLSCQNPNLQNIPIRSDIGRKIREGFAPQKEGWSYLAADYSQIELRLLAHLSEDPALIEAFHQGEDIHKLTASYIYHVPLDQVTSKMRYNAKAVNFGVVYGQQAFGLSQELGVDMKEASAFIKAYFERYPRVKNYVEESKEKARQTGKSVTYTGRERLIPEMMSKNMQIRAAAERLAINTPLQGTAADLIKLAMLKIDQEITEKKMQGYLILQIHDELIFEVPDEEIPSMEMMVKEIMQNALTLKVPLIVDISIGKNWAEC